MILNSKKLNFNTVEIYFFEDVDIDNILISNKFSFIEKNYKCFIG